MSNPQPVVDRKLWLAASLITLALVGCGYPNPESAYTEQVYLRQRYGLDMGAACNWDARRLMQGLWTVDDDGCVHESLNGESVYNWNWQFDSDWHFDEAKQ